MTKPSARQPSPTVDAVVRPAAPPPLPTYDAAHPRPSFGDIADDAGREPLCNGSATGMRCVHYWAMMRPYMDRQAALHGVDRKTCLWQQQRYCLVQGEPDELEAGNDVAEPMPSYCTRYRASDTPRDHRFEDARGKRPPPAEPRATAEPALNAAIAQADLQPLPEMPTSSELDELSGLVGGTH